MFLIFSLRRPNILPYGDLGVQKGLLRFALTAHNAFPDAKGKFQLKKKDKVAQKTPKSGDTDDDKTRATPPPQANNALPPTPLTPSNTGVKRGGLHTPNAPGGSTTAIWPPTPLSPGTAPQEILVVPKTEVPSATPDSAEDLLEPVGGTVWEPHRVAPLGAGLTIETMRSRWAGKKAK
jgi:DNA-3-methyladenine glycosylase II